jgi:threonine/homoserine/homoserine lactone efflux protein
MFYLARRLLYALYLSVGCRFFMGFWSGSRKGGRDDTIHFISFICFSYFPTLLFFLYACLERPCEAFTVVYFASVCVLIYLCDALRRG